MNRRKTTNLSVAIAALALTTILLSACSLDRWAPIGDGAYNVLHDGTASSMTAAREIQSLDIDRKSRQVVLTLIDGTQVVASFVPRDNSEWPSGCPTNINSTRMEVLDVAGPLPLGNTTLSHPVLVRDCPRDPVRLVLREDGAIGGASTACPYPQPCIYFVPR